MLPNPVIMRISLLIGKYFDKIIKYIFFSESNNNNKITIL